MSNLLCILCKLHVKNIHIIFHEVCHTEKAFRIMAEMAENTRRIREGMLKYSLSLLPLKYTTFERSCYQVMLTGLKSPAYNSYHYISKKRICNTNRGISRFFIQFKWKIYFQHYLGLYLGERNE